MALGFYSLVGPSVPREIIPDDVRELLISGNYQLMLVGSEYAVASDEVNAQCEQINSIIKKYDSSAMLIGEAPCTKDLIEITDEDFKRVSAVSIGAIFLIIALVFQSVSLPVILVSVIEFAIFIEYGHSGIHKDDAAVYCLYRDRNDTAWSNRRLCDFNDE